IQSPAVQAVQVEVFVVGILVFHVFKAHLQPALVEVVDGLFQEVRQLVQADGFFGSLVRQGLMGLLEGFHAVGAAPLPFVGKQAAGLQYFGQRFGLGVFAFADTIG